MGIQVHLTCLREICMQVRKQVRIGHGIMDWFKIGKGIQQGYILSPCLFNYYAEYIMWNARLDESQGGIKTAGRSINLRYTNCRWYHPNGRKWRGAEKPLDNGERREWKSWLKTQHSKNEDHDIQTHQFMTNTWGKHGNSDRFYFLGLQNHCRWWLQPWS